MIIETNCEKDTYDYAYELGKKAKAGDIYTLSGEMGAGKTVFSKGFAEGLGVSESVNSPTFTIIQVYDSGRLNMYHFDVYRIGDISEMDELGYEDYFFGDGVCLIEWADLIDELIPDSAVSIRIDKDMSKGTDYRMITQMPWRQK